MCPGGAADLTDAPALRRFLLSTGCPATTSGGTATLVVRWDYRSGGDTFTAHSEL
jgi:hypothetical protein